MRRKQKPRITPTHRLTPRLLEFGWAVAAKCAERGITGRSHVPPEVVDEVVHELYGGWTEQARGFVRVLERRVAEQPNGG